MPKIPGSPPACSCILQEESQHCFLAILTNHRLHRGRHATSTKLLKRAQTDDSSLAVYIVLLCFRMKYYGEVVRPKYMHTACNSPYAVMAAAVRTETKKRKYVIWKETIFPILPQ